MTILCAWYTSRTPVVKPGLCEITQFALVNAIEHYDFDKYHKAT